MTETARTVTYVVVAAVSLAVAWFAAPEANITPQQLKDARQGQEFFPDFTDFNAPTSIRVVTYDEAKAESRIFAVEFKDGLWTIPSHHNYPADGAKMLANTAASAIGIRREEFRTASKEDYAALGVLDPLEGDSSELKGRGQRITFSKGDTVLMDLIVGKPVRDRAGYYYVRVPSETAVYAAKVDIKLSTKFSDWVETNLLKVSRDQLSEIELNDYSIEVDPRGIGRIAPGQVSRLDRDKPGDPWKLAGLDDKTEELDTKKVDDLVSTLSDLKLVGVRPKPPGIRPDMTIDPEYVQNQLQIQVLISDLQARGFLIGRDPDNEEQFKLYSRQGELELATNNGVAYVLRFGEVFSGDESEIEFGGGSGAGAKQEQQSNSEAPKDEEGKKDESEAAGKQASRYLFVTTHFDDKYLGPKPVEPERPAGLPAEEESKKGSVKNKPGTAPKVQPGKKSTRPARKKQAPKEDEKAKEEEADTPSDEADSKQVEECGPGAAADDEKPASGDDKPADSTAKDADAPAKNSDDAPAEKSEAVDKPAESAPEKTDGDKGDSPETPKSIDELRKEYETLKEKYEADLKAYEDKLKAGQEKVDELNRRFGGWYYVISAESFNKLHLSRKDLVKEKTPAAGEKPAEGDKPPETNPPADDAQGQSPAKKPEAEKKSDEQRQEGDSGPESEPKPQGSP